MPSPTHAAAKAAWLLETIRRTPMVRGRRFDAPTERVCALVERSTDHASVDPRLAHRLARQFLCKCDGIAGEGRAVWREIGRIARTEVERLRDHVGLADRQVVLNVPQPSAAQVESLLNDLRRQDPAIARTLLNVALDAVEPIGAADRYLTEYRTVLRQLSDVDPASLARLRMPRSWHACRRAGDGALHAVSVADGAIQA